MFGVIVVGRAWSWLFPAGGGLRPTARRTAKTLRYHFRVPLRPDPLISPRRTPRMASSSTEGLHIGDPASANPSSRNRPEERPLRCRVHVDLPVTVRPGGTANVEGDTPRDIVIRETPDEHRLPARTPPRGEPARLRLPAQIVVGVLRDRGRRAAARPPCPAAPATRSAWREQVGQGVAETENGVEGAPDLKVAGLGGQDGPDRLTEKLTPPARSCAAFCRARRSSPG